MKQRGARPKGSFLELSITDSDSTVSLDTSMDSEELIISLSDTTTSTNSEIDVKHFAELPAGFMEARVLLHDIAHGNLLTPEQRRQLSRKSSATKIAENKRAKKDASCKVAKKKDDWQNWTSSSMESISIAACLDQSTPKKKNLKRVKSNGNKSRLKKNESAQRYVATEENPRGKKAERKKRENRKIVDNATRKSREKHKKRIFNSKEANNPTIISIHSSSSNASCVELTKENGFSVNDYTKRKNVNEKKPGRSHVKKLKHMFDSSIEEAQRDEKKKSSKSRKRKARKNNEIAIDKYVVKKEIVSPETSRIPLKNDTLIMNESNNTNKTKERENKFDDLKKMSADMENSIFRISTTNSTVATSIVGGTVITRENDFSYNIIDDPTSEDFCNLPPFLDSRTVLSSADIEINRPLEKKHCSLDSIARAIDNDLAAGNHLLPLDDCILPEILDVERSMSIVIRQEPLQDHVSGRKDDSVESVNASSSLQDTSTASAETASSFHNGKRKLPEIIKDDLLPKGTIDIATVMPTSLRGYRKKRRKLNNTMATDEPKSVTSNDGYFTDEISCNGKLSSAKKICPKISQVRTSLTKNKLPTMKISSSVVCKDTLNEKSCDEKLSSLFKIWAKQPEIGAFMSKKKLPTMKKRSSPVSEDTLNNNRAGTSFVNRNEIINDKGNSDFQKEFNALSGLLTTLDRSPSEFSIIVDQNVKSEIDDYETSPTKFNISSPSYHVHEETLNSTNNETNESREKNEPRKIEKLTIKNLDKFNETKIVSSIPTGRDTRNTESSTSRKRKWLVNDDKSKITSRATNGKIKLIRKNWGNRENWIVANNENNENLVDSSTTSQTSRSCADEIVSFERSNEAKNRDVTDKNIDENSIDDTSGKNVSRINDNFCKNNSLIKSTRDTRGNRNEPEIPSFGEPSIFNVSAVDDNHADNEASSQSFSSSTSSSTSSSSSSSSSSESEKSTFIDEENCETTSCSLKTKKIVGSKLDAPLVERKIQAHVGTKKIEPQVEIKKIDVLAVTKEHEIKVEMKKNEIRAEMKNIELQAETQKIKIESKMEKIEFQAETKKIEIQSKMEKIMPQTETKKSEIYRKTEKIEAPTETKKKDIQTKIKKIDIQGETEKIDIQEHTKKIQQKTKKFDIREEKKIIPQTEIQEANVESETKKIEPHGETREMESTDKSCKIEPEAMKKNNGLRAKINEIEPQVETEKIAAPCDTEQLEVLADADKLHVHCDPDELDDISDAATMARNTAGSLIEKYNETEDEAADNEEEEDCISLFTESLCTSRCNSPPLHKLSERRRSPNTREPYRRMRTSNIGPFVCANNRECEEVFEAYKDDEIRLETTVFKGQSAISTNESPSELTTKLNETKNLANVEKEKKLDFRTTLKNRITAPDITSFFKGHCYTWMKNGICPLDKACRFRHILKPILQDLTQLDQATFGKVIAHALANRNRHYLETVQKKLIKKMTKEQIMSLYAQLYRARWLNLDFENIIEALRKHGVTPNEIVASFEALLTYQDIDTPREIVRVMYKKLEPGTCWDVLGRLMTKARPPAMIIEIVLAEAIKKNCRAHAVKVYENMIKRMTFVAKSEIRVDLLTKFHDLVKNGEASADEKKTFSRGFDQTAMTKNMRQNDQKFEIAEIPSYNITSPESPRPDETPYIEQFDELKKTLTIEVPSSCRMKQTSIGRSRRGTSHAPSSDNVGRAYCLPPIDNLTPPKSAFRDRLWKFHWDLQGVQEGLKNKDYDHVLSVLSQYAQYPNRMPHINGFYDILCKEISASKHHVTEIVHRTVQSGSCDELRRYVYDLGVYVITKLADVGAWLLAYDLLETFHVYGTYNTCAFTLLAAEVYIANQRPLKALDLLKKSRIIYTNTRMWNQIQCPKDEALRVTVMDLLLYSLCDGHADHALEFMDFILADQCSNFKPINVARHVDKITRILLRGKSINPILEVGRLIIKAKLLVSTMTFRALINRVFHDDNILTRQLHRYATMLGAYNRAKINGSSCAHMIVNTDWTEEETHLMITSLIEDLYENIGHAVERLRPRDLSVYLIFEAIPSERQLATDTSDGPTTLASVDRRRAKVKSVLDKFDPRIKVQNQPRGKVCKLQSISLINYLKSGQLPR